MGWLPGHRRGRSGSSAPLFAQPGSRLHRALLRSSNRCKVLGHDAVLDGEVVVLDGEGRSRFQLLQNYQKTGRGQLAYVAFDLLHLDGRDLRPLPLRQRKAALARLVRNMPGILLSEHVETQGVAFFEAATARGPGGSRRQGRRTARIAKGHAVPTG